MTKNRNPSLVFCCLLALLAASGVARAEKADRDKPVFIEADTAVTDDANKVSTFTGNAVLTQGTLVIKGDKLIMRQDPEGNQYGTAYGNPAYFRQKREGVDEYVEGWGQHLEYDGKADKVELFTNARVKRGQDESRGDYISYDGKTEFFTVSGGKEKGAPARVHTMIMPKNKDQGAQPAKATGSNSKAAGPAPAKGDSETAGAAATKKTP
jgi:lipopolysaccharide export system protein LptA